MRSGGLAGTFAFGWIGQLILLTIAALIMSAWYLAAMPKASANEPQTKIGVDFQVTVNDGLLLVLARA